jgi:hypothetical protein
MNSQPLEPRFERDLHVVLEELAPSDVPPSLRSFVATVPEREPVVGRPSALSGRVVAFAAAITAVAATLAVVATAIVVINGFPSVPVPASTPSGSPSPPPSPSSSGAVEHRALTFRVVPADGHAPTVAELQAVSNVLLERLSVYQTSSGASFLGQGTGRLTVEIDVPANDPTYLDRVAATLIAPGQVRFVPLGSGGGEPGQTIDPASAALFGGDAVTDVSVALEQTGPPALDIVLSPGAAAATFAQWSAAHVGAQFAITLDGRIELAPVVASPVTDGHLRVSPDAAGAETIDRVAAVLRSGPLPASLSLVLSQP